MAYTGEGRKQEPTNALLHNESDGKGGRRFVNVLPRSSAMNAGDHGVQWVDYDRDGGLDLSLTDGYGPVGGHFLYRNGLAREDAARALSVLVLDPSGHFTRVGAEVRLRDQGGRILATRQVGSGDGYNTQSAQPVHFGLSSAKAVTVEVTYLQGGKRVVQTRRDVRISQFRGRALVVRERAGRP